MEDLLIFFMVIGGLMGLLGLMELICDKVPFMSRFIDWMVEQTLLNPDEYYEDDEDY